MEKIDLHMHSDISLDGQYSPGELAALCRKAGLNTVSLTDHNSVRGVEEMMLSGRQQGLKVLPSIELDCVCRGTDLHLLGYGIDITDRRFGGNEQNILEQKRDNSKACMKILKETGGKAVIAHPVNTVKKDEEMIAYMVRCGVEGMEVYSSYHSPEDREYYRELSARLGVKQTFGSDFHGKNKPAVRLGMTGAPPDAGDADWLF